MRRAVVDDFASVPGVRVVATLDARLGPGADPPGVAVRIITDRGPGAFEALAAGADWTALIAPETGGVLAGLARSIERAGGRSLGSGPGAIGLVGDKARLAAHLLRAGIPTPPTRVVVPALGLPEDWGGPIVVKPVDGAGSLDTFVVRDPRRCPPGARGLAVAVAQPYLTGDPMSACFLVDRDGRATLLAVGRQRIEVDAGGRISYLGGTIPAEAGRDLAAVEAAVASVPGLRGLVGVDFLRRAGGGAVVLEINPRPTTSIVGLARLLPPGTIAGAWLAAVAGGLAGSGWPDRLRPARDGSPVSFDADGLIRPE